MPRSRRQKIKDWFTDLVFYKGYSECLRDREERHRLIQDGMIQIQMMEASRINLTPIQTPDMPRITVFPAATSASQPARSPMQRDLATTTSPREAEAIVDRLTTKEAPPVYKNPEFEDSIWDLPWLLQKEKDVASDLLDKIRWAQAGDAAVAVSNYKDFFKGVRERHSVAAGFRRDKGKVLPPFPVSKPTKHFTWNHDLQNWQLSRLQSSEGQEVPQQTPVLFGRTMVVESGGSIPASTLGASTVGSELPALAGRRNTAPASTFSSHIEDYLAQLQMAENEGLPSRSQEHPSGSASESFSGQQEPESRSPESSS